MAISAHEAALPVSPLAILATLIPHFVAALISTPSCKDIWHIIDLWHFGNIEAKDYQMASPWSLDRVEKHGNWLMGGSMFKSQCIPKEGEKLPIKIKNIKLNSGKKYQSP